MADWLYIVWGSLFVALVLITVKKVVRSRANGKHTPKGPYSI